MQQQRRGAMEKTLLEALISSPTAIVVLAALLGAAYVIKTSGALNGVRKKEPTATETLMAINDMTNALKSYERIKREEKAALETMVATLTASNRLTEASNRNAEKMQATFMENNQMFHQIVQVVPGVTMELRNNGSKLDTLVNQQASILENLRRTR